MKKIRTVLLAAIIASTSIQSVAFADTDPYPGVATGGEIPGTRVSGAPNQSQSDWEATDAYKNRPACGAGAGNGIEVNATTHVYSIYCVKTWRPSADVNADATFRAAQDAAVAAATAESQAWNAANPGKQKCVQWGPIVHANGVSTASGGVCANPVAPGPGATVPSQSTDAVVGPTTAPSAGTSSTPAVIPTNDTSITGNGSPYTKLLPGQLSTAQCPVGFQAANGIIVAIGTGTFTECWPDLAWKANRLGGTYWEQFKASGGTYDVTAVIDALSVIADYKARAKAVAQAAADLTPGIQRCSTWSVYGQSGEECAYAFIQPSGTAPRTDSSTATSGSDTATVTTTPAIDTSTARSINTNNLDTSTAVVALVPVATPAPSISGATESQTATVTSQPQAIEAVQEVVVAADLSAKQYKGKVIISVDTNVEKAALTITATKKGGKTIEIPLVTNSEGERTLSSKLNLAGYTLTLKSGDQVLDKFVLKK
ncbi:hypothetical protein MCEPE89_00495 [Candidatus Planktophila dulcis]